MTLTRRGIDTWLKTAVRTEFGSGPFVAHRYSTRQQGVMSDLWPRYSSVKMLNPDPLRVWSLTWTSVTISVVPGETAARACSRKPGGMVTCLASSSMSGAEARPKLDVGSHSRRPFEPNLSRAE